MIIRSALVLASALALAGPAARAESSCVGAPLPSPSPSPSPSPPPRSDSGRPRAARSPERRRGRGMSWYDDEGVPAPMPVPVPSPCEPPPPCPPRGFAPYPPTVGLYSPRAAPARWPLARQRCLRDDAHLALPNSQIEVKVLMELMKINNLTTIHVGFYKDKNGEYFSVLGKKMSEKEKALWNAARWASEGIAECVALDAQGLASSPCDASLPFICEL